MKVIIRSILGSVVGVFLFWLLFRNTEWKMVWDLILNTKLKWLALSQLALWTGFFTRVQRWSYVVRATREDVSFRSMFSATQIGLFINCTAPLRIGEAVRAFVLAKLAGLSVAKSLAAATLDRVNDLIAVSVIMAVAVATFPARESFTLPGELFPGHDGIVFSGAVLNSALYFLGGVVVLSMLSLVVLYIKPLLLTGLSDRVIGVFSKKWALKIKQICEDFAKGLLVFSSASGMVKSIVYSLLTWGLSILSTGFLLEAFSIEWPWFTPVIIEAMMVVFIAAPLAPAMLGQFHLAVIISLLTIPSDMGLAEVKAFAISAHILSLAPVVVTGVFCLSREKFGFVQAIKESVRKK